MGGIECRESLNSLVIETLAMEEDLGRPLRYVQLNSFYNGSTGTAMRDLHERLFTKGIDSYILWGRRHKTVSSHEQCFATNLGYLSHGFFARLDDRMGFHSKHDTRRLLDWLDEINPDVVHLHNIHGYYVNIEMLFKWLAKRHCRVRWTLHDCWAFTGHCPHFEYVGCDRWLSGCHDCPQQTNYPASYLLDRSDRNWQEKQRIFTSIPSDRMEFITPSRWLASLVRRSFLARYRVRVVPNEIDRTVFRSIPSDFRKQYGIGGRFMVLGVASPWTERKGLQDFIRLASEFDSERIVIVLVGLSDSQRRSLPEGVIGIRRTESREELASIYSAADIFFNPTREDNYPTVNLEAEACGTPVVSYDTGGCKETLLREDSYCVRDYAQAFDLLKKGLRHAD